MILLQTVPHAHDLMRDRPVCPRLRLSELWPFRSPESAPVWLPDGRWSLVSCLPLQSTPQRPPPMALMCRDAPLHDVTRPFSRGRGVQQCTVMQGVCASTRNREIGLSARDGLFRERRHEAGSQP